MLLNYFESLSQDPADIQPVLALCFLSLRSDFPKCLVVKTESGKLLSNSRFSVNTHKNMLKASGIWSWEEKHV